ncbi:hypothetical protein JTB14_035590 [Gonioctena quinquepunctata]|nr:hypothetical protein JTB14_035590 [Gonioctena quinquepunctata]
MESLLSSFRREKAKEKKSVGTGRGREEIYLSKWFAFPRMAFLLDKDEPRPTIDSIEENDKAELDSEDELPENIMTEPEATNSQGIENEETEAQGLAGNNTLPSKPKEVSKVDQALGFLKNAASNSDLEGDECGVYGQHVAHKLRSYRKKTRAVVQHNINNIFFSAEMGQYDIGEFPSYQHEDINYDIDSMNTNSDVPLDHSYYSKNTKNDEHEENNPEAINVPLNIMEPADSSGFSAEVTVRETVARQTFSPSAPALIEISRQTYCELVTDDPQLVKHYSLNILTTTQPHFFGFGSQSETKDSQPMSDQGD